jgi:hypothetical protein
VPHSKGKNTLKLVNGKAAFGKVSEEASLEKNTLVWTPASEGATLTIKCMRGTYVPAFTVITERQP